MGSQVVFWLFIIISGLAIGSFLNVVIYRLPLALLRETTPNITLGFPGSFCPSCKTPIKWRHNIPLISFIVLRGRCAYCKKSISWHYPCIELLTALLTCYIVFHFQALTSALPILIFTWFLLGLIVIDFKHQLLPDELTLGLLWLGLLTSCLPGGVTPQQAILGSSSAYISFCLISRLYYFLKKQQGLGGGDIKLFAALGAWLGWQPLPLLVVIAGLTALVVNLLLILLKRQQLHTAFAFGPYLAIAGWILLIHH